MKRYSRGIGLGLEVNTFELCTTLWGCPLDQPGFGPWYGFVGVCVFINIHVHSEV